MHAYISEHSASWENAWDMKWIRIPCEDRLSGGKNRSLYFEKGHSTKLLSLLLMRYVGPAYRIVANLLAPPMKQKSSASISIAARNNPKVSSKLSCNTHPDSIVRMALSNHHGSVKFMWIRLPFHYDFTANFKLQEKGQAIIILRITVLLQSGIKVLTHAPLNELAKWFGKSCHIKFLVSTSLVDLTRRDPCVCVPFLATLGLK